MRELVKEALKIRDRVREMKKGYIDSVIPSPNEVRIITSKEGQQKGQQKGIKKRRTSGDIRNEILEVLRLSDHALTTKQIARKCRLNHTGCKVHLEYLEFEGEVSRFTRGQYGKWNYWRIKR